MRVRSRLTLASILLPLVWAQACDAVPVPPSGDTVAPVAGEAAPEAREAGGGTLLGSGFLVWESNRSGAWRIWTRPLDGGEPRQLTPDEAGRQHYAPHISPDGATVVYLSARDSGRRYPDRGVAGRLHRIDPETGATSVLVEAARTYFENRAVVWRSPRELIYIGEDFRTRLLDVDSGKERLLTRDPAAEFGWLVNSSLRHASTNSATFSLFDEAGREVVPRATLGGCQPYFSHDGRWGVWTAGAGGPLRKMNLESRRTADLLAKNDPRLPDDWGYLYFPMPSRDGSLLTFSASRNEHDHFTSDYEVFVMETDPATLEPLGAPVRYTHHRATDRYPDVYRVPLALGRHRGEAPFEASFVAPAGAAWSWSFGDGGVAEGTRVSHRYERPGRYEVSATRGGEVLHGLVTVAAPEPPRVVGHRLSGDASSLTVELDEAVDASAAAFRLASGRQIAGWRVGDDGRSLVLDLERPLDAADRLTVSGLADLAAEPNRADPLTVEIDPPRWPAQRDGLVFAWLSGDAENLVPADEGPDRAVSLTPRAQARLDHHWTMAPGAGYFEATAEDAGRVLGALQSTNELTLELTFRQTSGASARLVTFADQRRQNFRLELRGGKLVFHLRTGSRGPDANPSVELAAPAPGERHHVVVTYSPAQLRFYLDGERRLELGPEAIRGDFYHWRPLPLYFGGGDESLRLEGVAIYERVLSAAEVAASFERYRAELRGRPAVPSAKVRARLVAKTSAPSLDEISPYREALATFEYEVVRVLEGRLDGVAEGSRVRVAHWSILDGERQALHDREIGTVYGLLLEPFGDNPQLASLFLGQNEGIDPSPPLLHAPSLAH